MIINIAYKGIKYVVVFGVIYVIVKYTLGSEMTEIDIALVASVLTLLICVLENMVLVNTSSDKCNTTTISQENMGNVQTSNSKPLIASKDLNVSGSIISTATNNGGIPVTDTKNTIKIIGADIPDNESVASSVASSVSNSSAKELESDTSSVSSISSTQSVPSIRNVIKTANQVNNNIPQRNDNSNAPNPSSSSNIFIGTDYQTYTAPDGESNDQIDSLYRDDTSLGKGISFPAGDSDSDSVDKEDSSVDAVSVDDLANTHLEKPKLKTSSASVKITETVPSMANITNTNSGSLIRPDNALADVTPTQKVSSSLDSKSGNGKQVNITIKPSLSTGTGGLKVPSQPSVMNRVSPSGKPLKWYEQAFDPRQYSYAENLDQIAVSGGRTRNDILVNEMIYSDFNRLPPSFNDNDFEYGYSFLPPKDWFPIPPYPPVCVSNCSSQAQPVYLDTTTMDLKEWHETQKFTPPDSINTTFITNELNSKK